MDTSTIVLAVIGILLGGFVLLSKSTKNKTDDIVAKTLSQVWSTLKKAKFWKKIK